MPNIAGVHAYDSHLVWAGSTGAGIRAYDRGHQVVTPPATAEIALSADPHFRGDPRRANPEQLVVAAASSCQLLSFLAVAAREGVDVVRYEDDARGVMPEDDPPLRLTRIDLAPTITVAAGTDNRLVRRLVEQAHEECYVARSLRTHVNVNPTVVEQGPRQIDDRAPVGCPMSPGAPTGLPVPSPPSANRRFP